MFLRGIYLVFSLFILSDAAPVHQDDATGQHKSVIDNIVEVNDRDNVKDINSILREGDIMPRPDEHLITRRAAIPSDSWRWENLILNYEITPNTFANDELNVIQNAMNLISGSTCVTFQEYITGSANPPQNRIKIIKGSGCYSYVGRISSWTTQDLSLAGNLNFGCFRLGTVAHELIHALGFYHEQSRPDRDCHVKINFENIQDGKESNFYKQSTARAMGPYDILGVMHYSSRSFSKNGLPTIEALDPTLTSKMGQRDGLSQSDFDGINMLYKCPGAPPVGTISNLCTNKIDGQWTNWVNSNQCSRTCGGGIVTQTRSCTNPSPQNGGAQCQGVNVQTVSCNTQGCPVNGGWSAYVYLSACNVNCGGGQRTQARSCNNPVPSNGGAQCSGPSSQTVLCNPQACPVNGGWSAYVYVSACNVNCGGGQRTQSRSCSNPVPSNGGAQCSGPSSRTVSCNTQACPVNGGWTSWVDTTQCSVNCGGGQKWQSRTCSNPIPQNGGIQCFGSTTQSVSCNNSPCTAVIDGGWTIWTDVGSCTSSCGGGIITETRSCTNPTPQNGGQTCAGVSSRSKTCNSQACPIDGGWSTWIDGVCSKSCGSGQKQQTRSCNNPIPANNGENCQGPTSQTAVCNIQACPGTPISCGFGADLCDWVSTTSDGNSNVLSWSRRSGSTPSYNTGPSNDHSGQGYYIYVETSSPARSGHYAMLESPALPALGPSSKRCLTYYIHRRGGGMGETQVILKNSVTGQQNVLYTHTEVKNEWIKNQINFDAHYESQIIFKGIKGRTWQSDMALDDLIISPQACSGVVNGNWGNWGAYGSCSLTCGSGTKQRSRSCNNPAPSNGGSTCTGANYQYADCISLCPTTGSADCDFEINTCGWTINIITGNYIIDIRSGRTPSRFTGPESAKNGGTHYIYAEGSDPARPGDISTLTSPILDASMNERCLRFESMLYGGNVRQLRVFALRNGVRSGVEFLTGDQGKEWISRAYNLPTTTPTQVVFEFERGNNWNSDIAVDNVRITSGSCT